MLHERRQSFSAGGQWGAQGRAWGAVADPGLVIGAGPREGFGEGARPPRRRGGVWGRNPNIFFARHASAESF